MAASIDYAIYPLGQFSIHSARTGGLTPGVIDYTKFSNDGNS